MFPRLFRKAGSTGEVFFLNGGKAKRKGIAYSGLVGPLTTVAVVPTVDQACQFSLEAQTLDNQFVTISGDVSIRFDTAAAQKSFDFTVNTKDGGYTGNWVPLVQAAVIERVLGPLRDKSKTLPVEAASAAHAQFETAIKAALESTQEAGKALAEKGVTFASCSVAEVTPVDEEVSEALGSQEREKLLTDADKARHARRMSGVRNERTVKKYEAETALHLEEERKKLITQQGENEKQKAKDDAAATTTRLTPLATVETGKILAAAITDAARTGKLGSLAITSEFLAAIGQK